MNLELTEQELRVVRKALRELGINQIGSKTSTVASRIISKIDAAYALESPADPVP